MKRYFSILSVLFAATIAVAQTVPGDTINRTVLVESTYNPIVTNAVKRNFIPEEVVPSINRTAIVYADKAMPLTRLQHKALPTEKVAIEQYKGLPGYLHLGYGNSHNLDGLAAYHWLMNEKHSLSFNADIDGMNATSRHKTMIGGLRTSTVAMPISAIASPMIRASWAQDSPQDSTHSTTSRQRDSTPNWMSPTNNTQAAWVAMFTPRDSSLSAITTT